MIITMKKSHPEEQLLKLVDFIQKNKCEPYVVQGKENITISVLGETNKMYERDLYAFPGVEQVLRISKPFKLAARAEGKKPVQVHIPGQKPWFPGFVMIAGPCAVESEERILKLAKHVKSIGGTGLRGGAFKPRTTPYSFQGHGEPALVWLKKAKEETGLPIVSEVMDHKQLEMGHDYIDVFQVGARNMQNFSLLKEIGKTRKPVLLKRGPSAKIDELLMSAEYILSGGNEDVMLCERGIRSFDNVYSRNTLDLSAVPILQKLSNLPVIVDPSHGTGFRHLVEPMALAAVASGADGLIVEFHDKPEEALSDGPQALLPDEMTKLMEKTLKIREIIAPKGSKKEAA